MAAWIFTPSAVAVIVPASVLPPALVTNGLSAGLSTDRLVVPMSPDAS